MGNFYTLLGVAPDATADEITTAFERQQARYRLDPEAELDPELQRIAAERRAELERAYAVLANSERRRAYDAGLRGEALSGEVQERRSLTPRERNFAIAGVFVAVALLALIWVLTGRDAAPQGTAMSEVDRPAPAFSVPALDGGNVSLAEHSGDVVLLNFWATWCEPCKRELPALEQAHQTFGDQGLTIIGVNLTDDEQAQGTDLAGIASFLEQYGVSYVIALDMQGDVTNAYRVFPLPTSFFIDPQGRIRYVHIGELTYEDVAARFSELSREAPAASAR